MTVRLTPGQLVGSLPVKFLASPGIDFSNWATVNQSSAMHP
jgi:hypothetical protein